MLSYFLGIFLLGSIGYVYRMLEAPVLKSQHVSSKNQTDANRIPFYVYTGRKYDMLNQCLTSKNPATQKDLASYQNYFHSDDMIFASKIQNHAWRVLDPSQAQIFIIPVLLGLRAEYPTLKCQGFLIQTLVDEIARNILKEPSFKKHQGQDHLIVSSHFYLRNYKHH